MSRAGGTDDFLTPAVDPLFPDDDDEDEDDWVRLEPDALPVRLFFACGPAASLSASSVLLLPHPLPEEVVAVAVADEPAVDRELASSFISVLRAWISVIMRARRQ